MLILCSFRSADASNHRGTCRRQPRVFMQVRRGCKTGDARSLERETDELLQRWPLLTQRTPPLPSHQAITFSPLRVITSLNFKLKQTGRGASEEEVDAGDRHKERGGGLQNKETLDSINAVIQLSVTGYINLQLWRVWMFALDTTAKPQRPVGPPCEHENELGRKWGKTLRSGCGQAITAKTNISLRSSINKYVRFFSPLLAPFIQKQTRLRHWKATTRPRRIFQIKGHSKLKAQQRCGWRRITSLASVCLREIWLLSQKGGRGENVSVFC